MLRAIPRFWFAAFALLLWQPSFADEADMGVGLSDAQLADAGQRWVEAINNGDPAALNAVLDIEALGQRSAKTFSENPTERGDFVRGFMRSGERLAQSWIAQIADVEGHALFLRVHSFEGMRGALVRYDLGEQGYNYLLLIAEPRAGAAPRVVDMFLATNGQRISDTLGAISLLLIAPNDSLLGRLFGGTTLDRNVTAIFTAIGKYQREGKTAEAYDEVRKLPERIRNARVTLNISVQLASLLSEDLYREELARLARYHKDDPTAAFTLIDYYFFENNSAAAMEAIVGMERAFGADGVMAMMKANLAAQSGDLPKARGFAERSVELEPENETSRWTLLTILLNSKEYADSIDVLEGLESDFDYEFDDTSFVGNETFAGFIESPEYEDWIATR